MFQRLTTGWHGGRVRVQNTRTPFCGTLRTANARQFFAVCLRVFVVSPSRLLAAFGYIVLIQPLATNPFYGTRLAEG